MYIGEKELKKRVVSLPRDTGDADAKGLPFLPSLRRQMATVYDNLCAPWVYISANGVSNVYLAPLSSSLLCRRRVLCFACFAVCLAFCVCGLQGSPSVQGRAFVVDPPGRGGVRWGDHEALQHRRHVAGVYLPRDARDPRAGGMYNFCLFVFFLGEECCFCRR